MRWTVAAGLFVTGLGCGELTVMHIWAADRSDHLNRFFHSSWGGVFFTVTLLSMAGSIGAIVVPPYWGVPRVRRHLSQLVLLAYAAVLVTHFKVIFPWQLFIAATVLTCLASVAIWAGPFAYRLLGTAGLVLALLLAIAGLLKPVAL